MKVMLFIFGMFFTSFAAMSMSANSADTDSPDMLQLSKAKLENEVWKVEVHVVNDEALVGLDIPLRFGHVGDAVELVRVDFTDRVSDWDVKHAAIDNSEKTVIIGLISELASARPNAGLDVSLSGSRKIADLVFKKDDGYNLVIEPFTTERPGHSLTFIYNRFENGKPYVEEFSPGFEVELFDSKVAGALPAEYSLSQNAPNPFNPSTSFTLSLPQASDFTLRIFNITGQLVRSYGGHLEAGNHIITWDGRDDRGTPVASGVYFYSAEAGDFQATKKMIMLQ